MKPNKTCKDAALTLLGFSSRTEHELKQKLLKKGYEEDEVTLTLEFLKEYSFINDAEYANAYCRVHSSKKSKMQIRRSLEQKGIHKWILQEAMEHTEIDEVMQIQKELKRKKIEPGQVLERKQYEKLASSLFRKGYSVEKINQVLRKEG